MDPAQGGRFQQQTQWQPDDHEGSPEEMYDHEDVSKERFHDPVWEYGGDGYGGKLSSPIMDEFEMSMLLHSVSF